jgi:hypothetical protein
VHPFLLGLTLSLLVACDATSATSDGSAAVADMTMPGGGGDGGLLPLAAMCNADAQCASHVCAPYKMGAYQLCTLRCTALMPAPQCTSPGTGQCNGMGYCKFPGM